MKGNRAVLAAVVVIVLVVAGWWFFKRAGGGQPIDLVSALATAEKRPSPDTFAVTDATLNNESRRAIAIQPTIGTRLVYKVRVPDDAWLRVAVGLKPEAWDKQGDGVLFRVLVSDGRTSDPLFTQHVNPFANKGDRRWIPVSVDLSAYAGEEVDVVFLTNSSPPGMGENHDNDLALWGSPEIVIR
jgi:hypothetical protein